MNMMYDECEYDDDYYYYERAASFRRQNNFCDRQFLLLAMLACLANESCSDSEFSHSYDTGSTDSESDAGGYIEDVKRIQAPLPRLTHDTPMPGAIQSSNKVKNWLDGVRLSGQQTHKLNQPVKRKQTNQKSGETTKDVTARGFDLIFIQQAVEKYNLKEATRRIRHFHDNHGSFLGSETRFIDEMHQAQKDTVSLEELEIKNLEATLIAQVQSKKFRKPPRSTVLQRMTNDMLERNVGRQRRLKQLRNSEVKLAQLEALAREMHKTSNELKHLFEKPRVNKKTHKRNPVVQRSKRRRVE